MKIIVNMREHAVLPDRRVGYDEIVERAGFPRAKHLSVTYQGRAKIGSGEWYDVHGSLIPGESVLPADGMEFVVANTTSA